MLICKAGRFRLVLIVGFLAALFMVSKATASVSQVSWLDAYDVSWTTPSVDARGSMPLGNGEVGINAWVEPDGDLQFYINRSDSYSEVSRLLKVGLVRVHLSPNPFEAGQPFQQILQLRDGIIEITAGSPGSQCDLKLFVDAQAPVVHCVGRSQIPLTVSVSVESWRTAPRTLSNHDRDAAWTMGGAPFPLVESADHFPIVTSNTLVWYHRNEASCVESTLDLQGLAGAASVCRDPLIDRTFGGYVAGSGFTASGPQSMATREPDKAFGFLVACPCAQTPTSHAWIDMAAAAAAESTDPAVAMDRTRRWWNRYWDAAWIHVTHATTLWTSGQPDSFATADPANVVTQGYILQRYMQACGGRGEFPIKFNGGEFTVGPSGGMDDADYRRWGDCHWWQNVRLMYYPMLAEGDFDMMQPLFRMYEAAVPIGEARARLAEHVDGCYFPETMTIWGTYANGDYGWDRTGHGTYDVQSPWWSKTRNQGPELVAMMLDYWAYTQDKQFLRTQALPMATTVLTYFDQRYKRNPAGKIVLDPTQALETFRTAVDDTPTIAGLRNVCERLAAIPPDLTTPQQRQLFARMLAACPDIPLQIHPTANGSEQVIAPARSYYPNRTNVENPETYAIWPFRLYGLGMPGLEMARATYAVRVNHLPVGWGYDGNCAAVLGLADEAGSILQQKCENSNAKYRWPATWGPNFDWLPDQNHGGNLLETAQLMLVQCDGKRILLFPAWPKDWDVQFKLHAAYGTTVEASLQAGKITRLVVTPASRARDVEIMLSYPPAAPGRSNRAPTAD
jgi:hypothetical protein